MSDENSRFSIVESVPSGLSPHQSSKTGTELSDFLAFVLGTERYALPLSSIREIMKLQHVTEVPLAPVNVMGIISVRGRVTTLIDLRRLLSMPERQLGPKARVLLVDNGHEVLGLLVDRVLQVYRLSADEIELAHSMGGDQSEYIMGIGRPGLIAREYNVSNEEDPRATPFHAKAGLLHEESIGAEILILLDPDTLFRI